MKHILRITNPFFLNNSNLTMSEKGNEEPNKSSCDLNETNDEGEILTLSDILNEQREIDEVNFRFFF